MGFTFDLKQALSLYVSISTPEAFALIQVFIDKLKVRVNFNLVVHLFFFLNTFFSEQTDFASECIFHKYRQKRPSKGASALYN